jgi:hypothetical protein
MSLPSHPQTLNNKGLLKMHKKILVSLLLSVIVSTAGLSIIAAQPNNPACPTFIEQVQADVEATCSAVGANELCYGHTGLTFQWQTDAPDSLPYVTVDDDRSEFDPTDTEGTFASGDRLGLTWLESVQAAPADPAAGIWGAVVLNLATPDLQEQTGDTALVYTLYGGAVLKNGVPGNEAGENWAPFQSFVLDVGSGDSACPNAPAGLSIRSPENMRVTLMANGVEFTIGSTVHLELINGYLYIFVTEGSATIQTESGTIQIEAGQHARMRLSTHTNRTGIEPEGPFDTNQEQAALLPPPPLALLAVPFDERVTPRILYFDEAQSEAPMLQFLWGQGCLFTPSSTIFGPLLMYWGIGCFDSAVHANAHHHPADYQLYVDGELRSMTSLRQSGPHRHPPFCPWGWSFQLGPINLRPGEHDLRLVEIVTDTWSTLSGTGRNAGERVSMTCHVTVE